MWIGDSVKVFKKAFSKRNKYKLRFFGYGVISEHITNIGMNDETSIFTVTLESGEKIEVSEDKLELNQL